MSRECQNATFSLSLSKASIEAEINDRVRAYTYKEGGSGLYGRIKWRDDKVFDSYNEAFDYLNEYSSDYKQEAVKYKKYSNFTTELNKALSNNKTYTELQEKINVLKTKFLLERDKIHYSKENVKSSFISCKNCNSKINTQFINSNFCPVCKNDLRPQSTIDSINAKSLKLKELEQKREELYEKIEINVQSSLDSVIEWLVHYEWHE